MTPVRSRPVRVAVVDHEVVRLGVEAMLRPHSDRVRVVRLAQARPLTRHVDVVLVDPLLEPPEGGPDVETLENSPHVGDVVAYTWSPDDAVVAGARRRGVPTLPKSLDGEQLAAALCRIRDGLALDDLPGGGRRREDWPGRSVGLTHRESEVIALVTSGLSNGEIAEQTFLSINSVKSYIRSAYRAMGVSTRSQAVLWGIDNGMAPTRMPILLPPAS
ncbi:LuxR C-terminal-related transcriptional regulator [Knoellia sp. CPCC 206450]|uniref:helix-turn-helix transcriptional regulator n=1 Tax=Knoellia tibetensis TaxID=3404798 RepID=UPI003B439344